MAQALLSYSDLAERLGVSEHTIRRRVAERTWPCTRIGPRHIRFTEQQVEEILRLSAQPAVERSQRRRRAS